MKLMTREELYDAYLDGIEQLENDVSELEYKKNRIDLDIEQKLKRIGKLKDTAELYAPTQEAIVVNDLLISTESLAKDIVKALDRVKTYQYGVRN